MIWNQIVMIHAVCMDFLEVAPPLTMFTFFLADGEEAFVARKNFLKKYGKIIPLHRVYAKLRSNFNLCIHVSMCGVSVNSYCMCSIVITIVFDQYICVMPKAKDRHTKPVVWLLGS